MLMSYEMMMGMWSDPSSFTTSHVTTSSSDGCMNEVSGADPVPDGVCRLVWWVGSPVFRHAIPVVDIQLSILAPLVSGWWVRRLSSHSVEWELLSPRIMS